MARRRFRLFRPFGRTAAMLLLWEHRRAAAMAVRSLRHEARNVGRAGLDLGRWTSLLGGIWRSRDAADRGAVKSVIVDDAQRAVPLATAPVSAAAAPPAGAYGTDAADELRFTTVG